MELKTKLIGALTTLAIAGACLAPVWQAHIDHKNEQVLLEKAQQRQEQLARLVHSSDHVKSYLKTVSNKYDLNETQIKVIEAVSNAQKADIYSRNIKGYETDADIVSAAQEYAHAVNLRHLLTQFKPGSEMFNAVKALKDTTNIDMESAVKTVMNAHEKDLTEKAAAKTKFESEHKCEKLVAESLAKGVSPGFTCG